MFFKNKKEDVKKEIVGQENKNNQKSVELGVENKPESKEIKKEDDKKKHRAFEKYKNIDWKRVSSEKVFSVMAEVIMENRHLYNENERLSQEIEDSYKSSSENKDKSKEHLEDIAYKIAPNLINEINNGKKFKAIEMKEYIVSEVLKQKHTYMTKILDLTEKTKSYKELLQELQNQCYELAEQKTNAIIKEEEKEKPKTFDEKTFKELTVSNISEAQKEPKEQKAIMKVIPLERARNLFLQEDSLIVAEVLGKEGLSEFPEIVKRVKTEGISENRFETIITNLEKEDIIEVVKVFTFQRNTGVRLIKLKEEVGVRLYKEHFKEVPVKPEMQMIKEENDNYEHGYSIKDTLNVLKENYGYENVSMSRDKNTIQIAGRATWIPDIIGINPVSKRKEYFEVEMGTHNQNDFNYKLDKALMATTELKIICQNKICADRMIGKVKTWYNSKKTTPNIVIKVYSYVELKRKEKGRYFPEILEDKEGLLESTIKKTSVSDNKKTKLEEVV